MAAESLRNAVAGEEAREERLLLDDVLAELFEIAGKKLVRSYAGAGSPADLRRKAGVVGVLVRKEDELDVLQAHPGVGEPRLERPERRRRDRPGVDQRQRLAAEEPDVDFGLPLERQRDSLDHALTACAGRR